MFRNRNANLALSVIIAIILWGYVLIDVNPTVEQPFDNISVKVQNQETLLQRGLALTTEDYLVSVVIKGKRSDIVKINEEDIIPLMDVYGYALGTNYIPIKIELPEDVSLANSSNPKMEVTIEKYVVSNRTVQVEFIGTLGDGKEAGNIIISPKQVEVRGAKSRVEAVSQLLAEISLEDLENQGKATGKIQTLDDNGAAVNGVGLSATTLSVSGNIFSVKTLPLTVAIEGEIAEDYELESLKLPSEVTVVGAEADLKSIKEITANPVDISGINVTTDLALVLNLPKNVFLSDNVPAPMVNIKIKGFDTKTFEILSSEITFINLDPKYSAYVNTAKVKMILTGHQKVLSTIKDSSQFEIMLDLEGFTDGTFAVPLLVKHNKDLTNLVVSPSEVQVTITTPQEGF